MAAAAVVRSCFVSSVTVLLAAFEAGLAVTVD
jgi:hypothetical protein